MIQVIENGKPSNCEICPVAFEDNWTNNMMMIDSYCEKFKVPPSDPGPHFQEISMTITATKNKYQMMKLEEDTRNAKKK